MSRWSKLRALPWSDRGFLVLAVFELAAVGALVRVLGFERTVARLRRSSRRAGERVAAAEALGSMRNRARLIAAAARFGPYRATCLTRSLLLWWIARRAGLDPRLQIGVLREREELLAHAWVELGGEVVNDRAEAVARYAAFDARRLPERVSWS